MIRNILIATLVCTSLQAADTYFCYSNEVYRPLINLRTSSCMHVADLCKWDEIAAKAMEKSDLPFHEQLRIYSYLYQAQADAAALSSQVSGAYVGSLDPISADVLSLFLPKIERAKGDAYSDKLAEVVLEKVKERLATEKSGERFTESEGNSYGLAMAAWKPWHLDCPEQFYPCEPPAMEENFWEYQVDLIKAAQDPMTRAKRHSVEYWAGITEKDAGDWRLLANSHLFGCNPSLEQALAVRATLLTTLYDTAIVCFHAKYKYMVKRPQAYDPSVEYIIPCPQHPSYPSGHSTESGAAAVILSHYFPDCSEKWFYWADQAGWSRVWGGIHYPIDNEEGLKTGQCVAEAVLSRQ